MIFVDTSVWVSFFRGVDDKITTHILALLDSDRVMLAAPVFLELLTGASKRDLIKLREYLGALPKYMPSEKTWETVEEWIINASSHGQRFGAMDLLIGAIASESGGAIWSLDNDFARMEKLGFLDRFSFRV